MERQGGGTLRWNLQGVGDDLPTLGVSTGFTWKIDFGKTKTWPNYHILIILPTKIWASATSDQRIIVENRKERSVFLLYLENNFYVGALCVWFRTEGFWRTVAIPLLSFTILSQPFYAFWNGNKYFYNVLSPFAVFMLKTTPISVFKGIAFNLFGHWPAYFTLWVKSLAFCLNLIWNDCRTED